MTAFSSICFSISAASVGPSCTHGSRSQSPVGLRLLLLQLLLEPHSKRGNKLPEQHVTTSESNLQNFSASSQLSLSELLDIHLVEVDLVLHSAQGLLLKFAHLARLLLLQPAERLHKLSTLTSSPCGKNMPSKHTSIRTARKVTALDLSRRHRLANWRTPSRFASGLVPMPDAELSRHANQPNSIGFCSLRVVTSAEEL